MSPVPIAIAVCSFIIPVVTAFKNDRAILKTLMPEDSPWLYTFLFPLFAVARSLLSIGYFMTDQFSRSISPHGQLAAVSSIVLFILDGLIWYWLGRIMEKSTTVRLAQLTIITFAESIVFIGIGMIVPTISYGILHGLLRM